MSANEEQAERWNGQKTDTGSHKLTDTTGNWPRSQMPSLNG